MKHSKSYKKVIKNIVLFNLVFLISLTVVSADVVYFGNHTFISDNSNSSIKVNTDNGNYTFGSPLNFTSDYLLIDDIVTDMKYAPVVFLSTNDTFNGEVHIIDSLTNALIWGNVSCNGSSTNISSNDGSFNLTIPPDSNCSILDNFYLEEGVSRNDSPITLGRLDGERLRIVNLVDSTFSGIKINFTHDCSKVNYVRFESDTGVVKYNPPFSCSGNIITINASDVSGIEHATSSNIIRVYETLPTGTYPSSSSSSSSTTTEDNETAEEEPATAEEEEDDNIIDKTKDIIEDTFPDKIGKITIEWWVWLVLGIGLFVCLAMFTVWLYLREKFVTKK